MTRHILFGAGAFGGRDVVAGIAAAAADDGGEDLEQYRRAGCRADFPDAPMSERLGECPDCQRRMLLGGDR